jgi:hypothetical protein
MAPGLGIQSEKESVAEAEKETSHPISEGIQASSIRDVCYELKAGMVPVPEAFIVQ